MMVHLVKYLVHNYEDLSLDLHHTYKILGVIGCVYNLSTALDRYKHIYRVLWSIDQPFCTNQ